MENIIFASENINFIKVNAELVKNYIEMINDPEVANKISHNPKTYTIEQELEWVKSKQSEDSLCFSMLEKNTNAYIGNIEIMSINNNVGELGITITPKMQNKHYGSEAIKRLLEYSFNELNLSGLELNVYKTNDRAIKCYKNVGFVINGDGKTEEDWHMTISK